MNTNRKVVYALVEKPGDRTFWLRVGFGSVNRDGSINITLDAMPTNGKIQVRDYKPQKELEPEPAFGAVTVQ